MEKKEVIKTVLSVCEDMNLPYEKNVKNQTWKADVVVDYGKYKVAFNIGKCPTKISETYQAMRKERVCGCWLILDSKSISYKYDKLPCFPMYEDVDKEIKVVLYTTTVEDKSLLLPDFVSSLIRGKIKYADSTRIKYVDVRFYKKECWKCKRENDAYFVYKSISEDGIEIEGEGEIDSLNPILVKGIQEFIRNHPERNLVLGQIKPRYSKTAEEAYTSFGCAYCDSIFGAHYQTEDWMELIYEAKSLPSAIIELEEPISVPVNLWHKIEQ
jgi:hypothetical protein